MKANELMIGDIIYRQQNDISGKLVAKSITYLDIALLAKIENGSDLLNDDFFSYFPIPLTEEILKANGYINRKWENNCYTTPELNSRNICISIGKPSSLWGGGDQDDVWITVSYVHELQHILKFCGLNDLANNFKIEE